MKNNFLITFIKKASTLTPFFSMLYRRKIEIRNMKEVYVAFASHLPFGAVDQVGPHNFKNYLRKKAIASGKCGKDEIAKVVEEMYAAAMKFLSEVKEFETRTGLTIKTEYPPNEGSFMNTPAADLTLVMLEHLFAQYKGKYNLRELIDVFYLGSVISHKTDENAVHAFAKVIALRAGMNRAHAFTEDMACSSGLKGIGLAYDAIAHHGADFAIGGGVEKMSGVPDRLVRFGLTNPFDGHLMAGLADKTATMFGLTREELDDFAFEEFGVFCEYGSQTIKDLTHGLMKLGFPGIPRQHLFIDGVDFLSYSWVGFCFYHTTSFSEFRMLKIFPFARDKNPY
ncbi:hypothetical protein A2W54_00550 [Candidatus Giovannonibacteria bacterium RIFCSPHIGHO2_02_43_13]|uniref:Thiolase N-terminal domain-containing protein n=1 Tax=Candidatus Giovannonibacteria bacterium RIFCSPHIGHO2_02_43_13 TaxID=1798330 RepID=A0A1F5WSJ7_9BACT|nr:MAG: hypothetical protein A2W54_00550 [Candidatus Giovannonibacteria bacterium RIFCSPHIGHO2_02_43_13]